ncbi:MAG: hypothetical protein WD341_05115 [Tistlia sp.]|uniref:hypothetical protein n=1 Tax=Tistlia sp. TaxID=3057121 RepID=UPI0034A1B714
MTRLPLVSFCAPLVLALLVCLVLASASPGGAAQALDGDPLRAQLPAPEHFMPVPGGQIGVSRRERRAGALIEELRPQSDGGIVVGYCLRASCSHITHLVVLQVCSNAVGGPGGADRLVLGIVRLPWGRTPGYVRTLQGRDYAANYAARGPAEQILPTIEGGGGEALLALSTVGKGPVAPLVYEGLGVAPAQSRETLALQVVTPRDSAGGLQNARIEIRHLCQKHLS